MSLSHNYTVEERLCTCDDILLCGLHVDSDESEYYAYLADYPYYNTEDAYERTDPKSPLYG